jgi:alcohol dehydrogenase
MSLPAASRDVWRIDRAGSLKRLTRRREALDAPAAGQARVAVKAIGLNFADIFACLGLYSATPKGSFIPGLEFAGVVESVGPPGSEADERGGLRPGDAVVGLTRFGGYATGVNAPLQLLRRIRAGWDFAEAVALPAQGLTAWYGLMKLGALERGDVVLVHSAAGGVGLNALEILRATGAQVIATVGSESKREWLIEHRGLSKAQIIVRDHRSFSADLDRALGAMGAEGFDVAFDAVSGPFLKPAYDRLKPEGRLVVYGAADFMSPGSRANYLHLAWRYLRRPRLDPLQMISDNRSVMGFNLIWLWDRLDQLADGYEALDTLISQPPLVGRRFAFADAHAALGHLQSGHSLGKVVLEVR